MTTSICSLFTFLLLSKSHLKHSLIMTFVQLHEHLIFFYKCPGKREKALLFHWKFTLKHSCALPTSRATSGHPSMQTLLCSPLEFSTHVSLSPVCTSSHQNLPSLVFLISDYLSFWTQYRRPFLWGVSLPWSFRSPDCGRCPHSTLPWTQL